MTDLVERVARPCTCHPSEAPVPCRKQYAFLDCIRAEARAIALEEAARVAECYVTDKRALHFVIPFEDISENHKTAVHSGGQYIAAAIRAMIKG
jgi:ATP-dependent protease HslVU (ClpYQ) peptidase subunit